MGLELKTVFVIAISTARMVFPGIPAVTGPGDVPGVVPASKSMRITLMSGKKADAQSKAVVAVPEGLKIGESVGLHIDLTEPAAEPKSPDKTDGSVPKITLKSYCGCGEKITEGQPKVKQLSDSATTESEASSSGKVKPVYPEASYAYWPGPGDKPVLKDSSAVGTYALTTNYVGCASVTFGEEQDFLGPVELVGLAENADLDKPIKIEWKTVSNAVAYYLEAFGGNEKESIDWISSAEPDQPAGFDSRLIKEEDLKKLIEKKVLLPADATSCTIPAGIFKGSYSVILTLMAVGKDKLQISDGIETHVIVRSAVSTPLFSKPMEFRTDTGPE